MFSLKKGHTCFQLIPKRTKTWDSIGDTRILRVRIEMVIGCHGGEAKFKGCHRGGCQGLSLRGKTGRSGKWCLPNDRKQQWCLRTDREFKGFNCGIVEMVKGCHRGVVEMVNGCHRGVVEIHRVKEMVTVEMGCHCGVVEIGCHRGSLWASRNGVNGCHRGGGQGLSPLGMTESSRFKSCHHVVVEMIKGCHRGGFHRGCCYHGGVPGLSSWGSRNVFQRGGGQGFSTWGKKKSQGFSPWCTSGMSMVVTVREVNGFHRGVEEILKGCHHGRLSVVTGCHNWRFKGCHYGVVEMLGMMERSSVATVKEIVSAYNWLLPWGSSKRVNLMTGRSRKSCLPSDKEWMKSLPNDREVKGCQRGVVEIRCQSGWKWCLTNDREKTDLRTSNIMVGKYCVLRENCGLCPSNVYDRVYRLCQSQRDCNLNELQANLPQFTCKMYINVYMDHICIEVLTNPGFPGNHDWLPSTTCYWAIYPDTDRGEEVVRIPWRELTFVILSTCSYVLEGMPICDTQYLQMRACH
ncbi:hypothetical protein DPMN_036906 [Dreissena polymorpha]|uniref:Uncharacterized protein n=1 Tax=Dreissena polymorpha TaxID=45954 RepID=A0A9D4MDF5_DREPO|nr:hypothetical protein DPMN_036906 [Dreissena polymorpha]